jgi:hypothetical protein
LRFRDDHTAGRVGGKLVDVHDPQVGPLASPDRGRNLLVVILPQHGVHADVYVVVLGAELLDELAHERPVSTSEPVPERQVHLRPVVLLASATTALESRVVLRSPTTASQRQPNTSPHTEKQELLPRQPADGPLPLHHVPLLFSFAPVDLYPLTVMIPSLTTESTQVNYNEHI